MHPIALMAISDYEIKIYRNWLSCLIEFTPKLWYNKLNICLFTSAVSHFYERSITMYPLEKWEAAEADGSKRK